VRTWKPCKARQSRRSPGASEHRRRGFDRAKIRPGQAPLAEEIRARVAIHEIGHVIVSRELQAGTLMGVSLHDSGGDTMLDGVLHGAVTAEQVERVIAVTMAGRAAERLQLGRAGGGSWRCVGISPRKMWMRFSERASMEARPAAGRPLNDRVGDRLW
jgi:hypothetical protein